MDLDFATLSLVGVIFAFAGGIKGVIGLGLPTIATGMLGMFLPPAQAAAIVVLPALLTNVWQMWNGPGLWRLLRRLWPMLACVVIGTVMTAGIITGSNVRLNVALLGAVLMAYSLHALIGARFEVSRGVEPAVGALIGLVNGFISGATGVFVVPTVPFLQSINLDRDELVQAIGITAFVCALALAVGLGVHGGLQVEALWPAVIGVLAALAGMVLGQSVRARLSLPVFRRWVLVGLLGLGASMTARGFY